MLPLPAATGRLSSRHWALTAILCLVCLFHPVGLRAAENEAPDILTQPADTSVAPGRNAVFTVAASGSALAYQWYRGPAGDTSQPLAGATGAMLVATASPVEQSFWVRVSNAAGTSDSAPARLAGAPEIGYCLRVAGRRDYRYSAPETDYTPEFVALDLIRMSAGGDGLADHYLFIKSDHTLWGMGENSYGQLGDGTTAGGYSSPVQTGTNVTQVAAGGAHSLFIKTDGTLWATGSNESGQLGTNGVGYHVTRPVQIGDSAVQVSAGPAHSLFVKADGTLWAMGANESGQLGDGTTGTRLSPVQVATGVVQGWCGGEAAKGMSLFLKRDGSFWAMGANDHGQLGDGTFLNRPSPVQIASGVRTGSCGLRHALFIKADGSLWIMGQTTGQFGDTSATDRNIPRRVAEAVVCAAAGNGHSHFLNDDGVLSGTGNNAYGQLGDGTSTAHTTPAQTGVWVWDVAAGKGDYSLRLQTPPPRIIEEPADTALLPGDSATLSVTATDDRPFTYQWWSDAPFGGPSSPIPGATQPVFTTPPLFESKTFWVRVANAGSYTESRHAKVSVCTQPTIVSQPWSNPVSNHSAVTLSVYASGEALHYQWYRGASGDTSDPMEGATTASCSSPASTDTRSHWVRVWNLAGSVDSATAVISVLPAVTTQPAPTSSLLGQNATFTVAAVGSSPLAYQWYRGPKGNTTQPAEGATGPVLTVVSETSPVSYWVRITNAVGTADSVAASVTGIVPPSFTAQPGLVRTVFSGGGVLRAEAAGGVLSYQWYHGEPGDVSAPVTGATGAMLVTPPSMESTRYWLRATNAAGTVDSGGVTVEGRLQPRALRAMGANAQGQLGQWGGANQLVPRQPLPLSLTHDVVQVAAGANFSLFVRADGTLWTMGANSQGQLGDGSQTTRSTPVQVATGVAMAAAGEEHSLFLKRDGTLWGMGCNSSGQLGVSAGLPGPVQIATGVASVAAGLNHSLFIKADGSLWGMGSNSSGQLGDGSLYTRFSPVQVATNVVQAAAGAMHSLFVKADGTAWGMGSSQAGQLASYMAYRSTPVTLISGVAGVAAGCQHSLFVKTDGTLWGVGANDRGQLGDGTRTRRSWIVQIAESIDWAAGDRSASAGFSLFVKRDGSLWAMGADTSGQLGNGSTSDRLTPVQIALGVSVIAAGASHSLFIQYPPPTITVQPAEAGILSGQAATLQVAAQSEFPISYQWYAGLASDTSQPLAGETAAIFTTPALSANASYWVRVSNPYDKTDSATAPVTLCTPPAIASAPLALVLLPGRRATLSVAATGGALHYQWYEGATGDLSAPVAGTDAPDLLTSPLTENASYWVRVTNAAGTVDSPAAPVRVRASARLLSMGDNSYGQLGLGFGGEARPAVFVAGGVLKAVAGGSHTLFLKTDGTLWAAGRNYAGQLGDGTTTDRQTPVQIATDVVEIAAGAAYSLFIKSDATLWGMGANESGQLGDGTAVSRSTPVQIATAVTRVAAGDSYTLFCKADGSLYGSGMTPALMATDVIGIAAGSSHRLVLKSDGSLWAAGWNIYGQLGDGTTTSRQALVQVATGVSQVAAGADCTWFLKTDGTLWTVGYGRYGQLADGGTVSRSTPAQVATAVARIAVGGRHGLFVKTDGTLWAAGDNALGQLGDGTLTPRSTPVEIAGDVVQISAGASHSLFVTADGTLRAVGANTYGQLGNGERGAVPAPAFARSDVVAIAAGASHTLFIQSDRSLWGVGDNASGQLGDGTTTRRSAPVKIADDVASVAAGAASSFFIKTNGSLWAMGSNSYGVLGTSTSDARCLQPTWVASDVAQVDTSGYHTLFVKTDETLWAMGANFSGQLGRSTPSAAYTPLLVSTQVRRAAGGGGSPSGFSAFIKTDGTIWTMGINNYGQLGNGSVTNSGAGGQSVPGQIASGVEQVFAGPLQLFFIDQSGTLRGAGWNGSGALGLGGPTLVSSPTQITTQVRQVASGQHTLVLKYDGSLWSTGVNASGQLGDGTVTSRSSLVQIASGVLDIAVGAAHSLFLQSPSPEILLQPAPLVRRVGTMAEFAVTASGDGTLDYQWRRNGAALDGPTARTSRLTIDAVQLTDAGDYDVVVSNDGVPSFSLTASLTVHTEEQTTYAAWAAANAITGDALADPEGGGAPNLLRYAFDLPAHGPVLAPVTVQTANDTDGAHLAVAFTRKTYAPGLRYVVESSADLVNWSTVSTTLPGLPETVVVRDSQPLTATQRRFLRVRAEITP